MQESAPNASRILQISCRRLHVYDYRTINLRGGFEGNDVIGEEGNLAGDLGDTFQGELVVRREPAEIGNKPDFTWRQAM